LQILNAVRAGKGKGAGVLNIGNLVGVAGVGLGSVRLPSLFATWFTLECTLIFFLGLHSFSLPSRSAPRTPNTPTWIRNGTVF
jgi:hypothetical protein